MGQVLDDQRAALIEALEAYPQAVYMTLNDLWFLYLGTLGYTQATLLDRMAAYARDEGIPLTLLRNQRTLGATPQVLFNATSEGVWYDISDMSTLYQDSAATTPVTAVGQPVGFVRDKSGKGHHLSQSTAGNRPVLGQTMDGKLYLDFASSKSMSAASTIGVFNYLHNGAGGTILAQLEYPQSEVSSTFLTTCSSTAQAGIQLAKSAATQNGTINVCREASGVTAVTATCTRLATSSRHRFWRSSYKNDGGANDCRWSFDSSIEFTGQATANAPVASNNATNLTINSTFQGKLFELVIVNSALSERAIQSQARHMSKSRPEVDGVEVLLLLGGQSNCSGRGTILPTAEEKADGVFIYDKSEAFAIAYEPTHSVENRPVATSPDETTPQAPAHSFGLKLGKNLAAAGSTPLLVPCAIGGTSMSQWAKPSTKQDRTTLFGAMDYRYNKAKAKGGTPVIVWYGHEANAGSVTGDFTAGTINTTYQTAWNTLVTDLRTEIVNAPIVFCQLSADDTLADSEKQALAGEAQRQLELSVPNSFMVVTHDVARNASPDDIHVSKAGQLVIADRISLAIRERVLGESVNGTGPRIVGATRTAGAITLTCNKTLNSSGTDYGSLFRVYDNGVEQTVLSAVRGANTSTIVITVAALTGPTTLTYGHRAGAASVARTDFVQDSDALPLPLFGPIPVPAA